MGALFTPRTDGYRDWKTTVVTVIGDPTLTDEELFTYQNLFNARRVPVPVLLTARGQRRGDGTSHQLPSSPIRPVTLVPPRTVLHHPPVGREVNMDDADPSPDLPGEFASQPARKPGRTAPTDGAGRATWTRPRVQARDAPRLLIGLRLRAGSGLRRRGSYQRIPRASSARSR